MPPCKTKLEQAFQEQLGPEPPRPTLKVDALVNLAELNREFFQHLERLRPFGPGNPAPVFVCTGVECLGSRVVGERHLKVQLNHQNCVMEAIAFNQASQHPLAGDLEVAFSARLSHYQGRIDPGVAAVGLGPALKAVFCFRFSVFGKRTQKAVRETRHQLQNSKLETHFSFFISASRRRASRRSSFRAWGWRPF